MAEPKVESLALSSWPYPCHLAVTGLEDTDTLQDVSDEEDPTPGRFMYGKNGRLLRPLKKAKVAARPGSSMDSDPSLAPVALPEGQGDAMSVDPSENAGAAKKLTAGFNSLLLSLCPKVRPESEEAVVHPEATLIEVLCCVSKFGLPPSLYFCHKQALAQVLPPCPPRFSTAALSVAPRNAATGLFFRIGPGAVAFRVVLNVFSQSGLTHTHHPTRWNVLWAKRVAPEEWAMANEYQKVNHFPGTRGIARKDNLARNALRLKRQHPDGHFAFVPTSYVLPPEMQAFETDFRRHGGTWILKPSASSCGKGIRLINSLPLDLGPKAKNYDGKDPTPAATWVIQQYIDDPFLIDGFKFDLRVYVLVTSFDPLRIYVFNEGLVRFATERYTLDPGDLSNTFMHLTNYSLNKHSTTYVTPAAAAKAAAEAKAARAGRQAREEDGEEAESDDDGREEGVPLSASKWTLTEFMKYCRSKGIEWAAIQAQIHDVIIKTFISVEAEVLKEMRSKCQQPKSCFELFGWDLMLDADLKVWLIEVNLMPSLSCTTALDKAVKYALVQETLTLAGPRAYHRTRYEEADAAAAHPRWDDVTFQSPAEVKALLAQLNDPARPFLDILTPEQRLMIMESEDELSRRQHFTRIFPTAKTWSKYGRFFEGPRPNNALLARWEKEKKRGAVTLEALSLVKTPKARAPANSRKAGKKAA